MRRDPLRTSFINYSSPLTGAPGKILAERSGPVGKVFTLLTVTNKGSDSINRLRVLKEGSVTQEELESGVIGDPGCAGGNLVFKPGLRLRLTRNLDKTRGFVNGALCIVQQVLGDNGNVAVVKTLSGVLLLLHPIYFDGQSFMPCTYGYAMTIRRAQGATLEAVGLYFDHCFPPDPGYAYVGSSRVRRHEDLFLVGHKVRRSDWVPVGMDKQRRSAESESDDSDQVAFDDDCFEMDSDAPASDAEGEVDNDFDDDDDCVFRSMIERATHETILPELEQEAKKMASALRLKGKPGYNGDAIPDNDQLLNDFEVAL